MPANHGLVGILRLGAILLVATEGKGTIMPDIKRNQAAVELEVWRQRQRDQALSGGHMPECRALRFHVRLGLTRWSPIVINGRCAWCGRRVR